MIKLRFPFLKVCGWLYQSVLSAGVLFLAEAFFRDSLARVVCFPDSGGFLAMLFLLVLAMQFFLFWPGESITRSAWTWGLLILGNLAAAYIFWRYTQAFESFLCYAAVEAACLLCCTICAAIRQKIVLKGILSLGFAAGLTVLAVLKYTLPGWCVCSILLAVLLFLAEAAAKKRKEPIGLLPVFAAALAALLLLPAGEKPADWSWIINLCTAVQEQADAFVVDIAYFFGGEGDFSFSFAGYGTGGEIGGGVSHSSRPQLQIKGMHTKNPLYLTGDTYEVYTGGSWAYFTQKTPERQKDANSRAAKEENLLVQALPQSIYEDDAAELFSSARITVEYKGIRTVSFFHDLHTQTVYFDHGEPAFAPSRAWTMEKSAGKGFTYQFQFLEVNYQSEKIKQLLRQQAWKEAPVWEEDWREKEAEIKKQYTQLPETLPGRVRALAGEITRNADNDYDKMCAIAAYLQQYPYTKSPPACPAGQDFTDFFLFDGKSGYCTYFATAMAVLGRCEGIPTRYVKGFTSADTCEDFPNGLDLTGDQAHAWIEFYISHVGWVPFDATPGYGTHARPERWQRGQAAYTDGGTSGQSPFLAQEKNEREAPASTALQGEGRYKKAAWITGTALLFLLAMFIAFALLRQQYRYRRYKKAGTEEKMFLLMRELLRIGKLYGRPVLENETLAAYAKRLEGRLDTPDATFADMCGRYEKARFGREKIRREELEAAQRYMREVTRQYLASQGFLKKLAYRVF